MSPFMGTMVAPLSEAIARALPYWHYSGPSLALRFDENQYLMGAIGTRPTPRLFSDLITFTRASGGGRFNSSGVYEWVGNDVPRFDYDPVTKVIKGLLIEEQRTNLMTYSERINNGVWGKSSAIVSPDKAVAPDGTLTASYVSNTPSVNSFFYQTLSLSTNTTYTRSLYVKWVSGVNRILFELVVDSAYSKAEFDVQNGTVVSAGTVGSPSATITSVGNGWYRCTHTFTTGSGANIASAYYIGAYGNTSTPTTFAIWGAQMEVGAFPTSYIPSLDTWTSRASTATYFDANGVMQTAASGVARSNAYGVDSAGAVKPIGLLLEGVATNLLTRTERGDMGWNRPNTRIVPEAWVAPNGLLVADKLIESTASAGHQYSKGFTVTAGATYAASIFVKAAERTKVVFRYGKAGAPYTRIGINVDLSTGGFTPSHVGTIQSATQVSATPAGGGWYRLVVAGVFDASSTDGQLQLDILNAAGADSYAGDNVSGVYIWGAQLETGSVATSYIPSTDTFTSRASTATYLDASGVLQTAGVDVARSNAYAYDNAGVLKPVGLLLEGSATNLLKHSEQIDNAAWSKYFGATITPNFGVAPDGSTSADRVNFDGTSGCQISQSGTTTVDVAYTYSGYYRDTSGGSGSISVWLGGVYKGSITPTANWQRFSFTHVATTTGTSCVLTQTAVRSFEVWGLQLETGFYATSYIPTTTSQVTRAADVSTSVAGVRAADVGTSSQVTRAADVCSVNTLSPWYRADEGTLFVEGSHFGTALSALVGVSDGTSNNRILLRPFGTGLNVKIVSAGTNIVDNTRGASPLNNVRKYAATLAASGVQVFNAGVGQGVDAVTLPTVNRLHIGTDQQSTGQLSGHIRAIRYYPRKLSDADLQTLTTP